MRGGRLPDLAGVALGLPRARALPGEDNAILPKGLVGRSRVLLPVLVPGILALMLAFPARGAWAGARGRVLLLNSYHSGMDWTDGLTRGVREGLQASGLSVDLTV